MRERSATWIGDNFPNDAEFLRLRALEEVWDANTCSVLASPVAVQRGWRCLELGAGAGSIARWLADRVGPSGSVIAADLNCRFLIDMPANVEVRSLNATETDFGRDEFDLIHHRSVLSYVGQREQVLSRLARSLRPGGWLVSEEPDFRYRVIAGDSDEQLLARFFQALRLILKSNGVDFSFAPRLVTLFRELGFVDIGHSVRNHAARGGSPISEILWRAVEPLRSQLRDGTGFTDNEVDQTGALLRSREVSWDDPAIISVFGRRPA
jgi:ubiquinone/menaquinone biosynthesis C-methylase UbiE